VSRGHQPEEDVSGTDKVTVLGLVCEKNIRSNRPDQAGRGGQTGVFRQQSPYLGFLRRRTEKIRTRKMMRVFMIRGKARAKENTYRWVSV